MLIRIVLVYVGLERKAKRRSLVWIRNETKYYASVFSGKPAEHTQADLEFQLKPTEAEVKEESVEETTAVQKAKKSKAEKPTEVAAETEVKLELETAETIFVKPLEPQYAVPETMDVQLAIAVDKADRKITWLKDGKEIPKRELKHYEIKQAETNHTLTIHNATKKDEATYTAKTKEGFSTSTQLQVQGKDTLLPHV